MDIISRFRSPIGVVLLWIFGIACLYLIIGAMDVATPSHELGFISTPQLADAVVYIAASKLAEDSMVDYSIASLRKIGKWKGDIYILTDRIGCFDETVKRFDVKVIQVQKPANIIEIKSMKSKLFSYLPESVGGVLYLDADILVARNLRQFWRDLSAKILAYHSSIGVGSLVISQSDGLNGTVSDMTKHFDFAMFPDAKGHYVGFCSGCEKWHTGIIWLRRDANMQCMRKWEEILLSGKYDTDQESIDDAERTGACPRALSLPDRHLL